jgi:hypothetical protein
MAKERSATEWYRLYRYVVANTGLYRRIGFRHLGITRAVSTWLTGEKICSP